MIENLYVFRTDEKGMLIIRKDKEDRHDNEDRHDKEDGRFFLFLCFFFLKSLSRRKYLKRLNVSNQPGIFQHREV